MQGHRSSHLWVQGARGPWSPEGPAPSLCLPSLAAWGLTSSVQQAGGLWSFRILPRRGYPRRGRNGVVADGGRRARRRPMNIQCRRLPEEHLPINYWSCGTSPSLHRAEMRVIPLAPSPRPPAPHQPLCNERRLAAIPEGIDGSGGHRGSAPLLTHSLITLSVTAREQPWAGHPRPSAASPCVSPAPGNSDPGDSQALRDTEDGSRVMARSCCCPSPTGAAPRRRPRCRAAALFARPPGKRRSLCLPPPRALGLFPIRQSPVLPTDLCFSPPRPPHLKRRPRGQGRRQLPTPGRREEARPAGSANRVAFTNE